MSSPVAPTAPAIIDSTLPGTSFHLRAIRVPDGNHEEDWWIANGRLQQQPVAGATDLDGRYVMSGMVDAHTHLSMGFGRFTAQEGSAAVIAANLDDKARQGVLAVRDAGVLPGAKVLGTAHPCVRVIACGNLNAPTGRFHNGIYQPIEASQLRAALLDEIAAGQQWVKIVADFPGPDINFFDPIVNYPLEVVHDAVEAVHAAGARVAAHVSGPIADDLVRVGVDSIEHGTMLTRAGVEEMARHETAWVPTLSTVVGAADMVAAHGAPFIPVWRAGLAKLEALLPLAEKLGVCVMAGSDEHPADLVADVLLLHRYGLSPAGALQAVSSGARRYLGLSAVEAGAPADLLLFDHDPRQDLSLLRKPVAIVFGAR